MSWYDLAISAYRHKGSDRKTLAGAAQSVTIPSGAKFVEVTVEDGDARVAVDTTANGNSSLLVSQYMVRKVWLVGNTSLSVFGSDCYANFDFYG